MQGFITILFFFWIVSSCSCYIYEFEARPSSFNVLDYGAVGDGRTDASQAFLKAWEDLCGAIGEMPTLQVPAGYTFLLKPVAFHGPCKSNNPHIQIQGTLVAPNNIYAWDSSKDKWLLFSNINGLIIDGRGQIDGQGYTWWKYCREDKSCIRPSALKFNKCNGLRLSELKHVNSQRNHISINNCEDVNISNLLIVAPEHSPNTDGIDISASSHVNIHNSVIGTGDDCIAINGHCSYINISGIMCGPGHGISVGSLGRNGAYDPVEEVSVKSCTFKGTQNGVRIKTWKGGLGYARKIHFEKITLEAVRNPIIIDQNYLDNSEHNPDSDIEISDITYREVHGTSADETAIKLTCSDTMGCSNIIMDIVNITYSGIGKQTYASCRNAYGRVTYASPNVPCLSRMA